MPDANSPEKEKTNSGENLKKEDELPKVRTFKSDIEQYVEKRQPSLVSIAAEHIESGKLSPESGKLKFFTGKRLIFFGALFLLIGGAAALTLYFFLPRATPQQEIALRPPQPLIPAEEEQVIEVKEGDRASIILAVKDILGSRHPRKSLLSLPILLDKKSGARSFAGSHDFLRSLEINPPAELALKEDFLFGVFSGGDQLSQKNNSLVFIFKIISYDETFAGMLAWEKSIVQDFKALLPRFLNSDTGNEIFRDAVIKNQDVRYIINVDKEPVLFYTIFNRQILLIATSQEALEEMVSRLALSFPQ